MRSSRHGNISTGRDKKIVVLKQFSKHTLSGRWTAWSYALTIINLDVDLDVGLRLSDSTTVDSLGKLGPSDSVNSTVQKILL